MTLTLANLIVAVLLLGAGLPLLLNSSAWAATLKRFPRSRTAAYVLFSAGAAWFLYAVWHLSMADFGEYRGYLFIGFALIAVLSFKCVPDFLAVRGLCAVVLMGAMPLLDAGYMNFESWAIDVYKVAIFVAIAGAIWLAAQPWRMRDFIGWLLARPGRARTLGGVLTGYGLLVAGLALTF